MGSFVIVEDSSWPRLRAGLAAAHGDAEWPAELVELDMAWHASSGTPLPGRPTLMARWNWKDHQVRKVLASRPPGNHQETTSVSPADERSNAVNVAKVASVSPGNHQRFASRAPAVRPAPAFRQETTSPTTVQPSQLPEARQETTSVSPALTRAYARIDPGSSSPDPRSSEDPDRSAGATVLPLFAPTLTPEQQEFLRICGRWSTEPPPKRRLRTNPSDLAWFTDVAVNLPVALGVDILGALAGWDRWISDQHEAANAGKGDGRVPKNVRTTFETALAIARDRQGVDRRGWGEIHDGPRGSPNGAAQSFGDTVQTISGGDIDDPPDDWRNQHLEFIVEIPDAYPAG